MSHLLIMMPLEKHCPNGGDRPGWELTKCPVCGQACFRRYVLPEIMERNPKEMCTECALKEVSR